jgi:hypothetical protein
VPSKEHYARGLPLKIGTDSIDRQLYYAKDSIKKDAVVIKSIPYVGVLQYGNAEKFCAHCHVRIGIRSFQSKTTYDFYEFQSCRDACEDKRDSLYRELRSEFRSRFLLVDSENGDKKDIFKISNDEQIDMSNFFFGPFHFTWFRAIAEILCKRGFELQEGKPYVPLHFRREATTCRPVEPNPDLFLPKYEDFVALPVGEKFVPIEQRKMFENIAYAVHKVVESRDVYSSIKLPQKEIYENLCRLYVHQKRIIRESDDGTHHETGFGVYPTSRYVAPSLNPNCDYFFDINKCLVIRANRNITPEEQITIGHQPSLLEEIDFDLAQIMKPVPLQVKNPAVDNIEDELFVAKREY